ncbi:MAG TPA: 23S rRNA (guanosine(2251)-2'-O)-methyltransferase RlmB [Burkholderiales bacterium]|jgi:23S rRNA (guanosine2251-2'-O)-methyltransferase|nr:23S rRNA (guanosine(2251)-2'-O)-methyltransferase RlmB [Burkholderiales bacterium]
MSAATFIHGFHAVQARLRNDAASIFEIYVDANRKDPRMRDVLANAERANVRIMQVDDARLSGMAGASRHQGVVARVKALQPKTGLDDILDALTEPPLLLVLDGVTDPHNLGAALRVADAAGAHAVIAPKDRSAGLSSAAIKVASGAAESVPYVVVTNLARTLDELKEREIWIVGAADETETDLYAADFQPAMAFVLGSEGEGMRRLTREHCDVLVRIPMHGQVESLNVSVAAGICLYEARRRRAE